MVTNAGIQYDRCRRPGRWRPVCVRDVSGLILALAPVISSLEIFLDAGLPRLIEKSRLLTDYMRWLIETRFADSLDILTRNDARGAQLSLVARDSSINARTLFERLCELNVTGDWREPGVIRVAPAPLYNSFGDVFELSERMARALSDI